MVSEPTIMDPVANNSSPLLLLNNMSNLMSIKLDSVNYMIWKLQLSAILDAYSMIEHLDGSTQQPRQFLVNETGVQSLNPTFLIWKKKDKALLTLIYSTLSSPVLAMVVGSTTSQEVWNRLEGKFTCTARANVLNLKLELQGIKKDPFPNSALAMFVSNNQKPHTGFNGGFTGSQGYNRGRGGRNSSNRGKGGRSFGSYPSYPSSPQSQMPQSTNSQPPSQFSPQGRSERPTCQICWKIGHYAIDCYHRMDFAYQGKNPPTKLAAMASASNLQHTQGSETWLIDTGATDHITSNASSLNTPTPYHGSEQVIVGNGQNLPIQSIVHKLCLDNNCSCYFDAKQLLIQDLPTGRLLYKGLSKDGVYPIHSSQFCSSASPKSAYLASSSALKWQLWHSRLGHPSAKVLHSIFPSLSPCNTLDFNSASNHCYTCLDPSSHRIYTSRHVLFNETVFPGLHTSDQSNSSPQITAFSSDIWLNTLHTLHYCAQNQAPIPTVLDSIPTLPPTLHTDTPSLPSASVSPHSPNQSPAVPISVSCHDSRFIAPTPDTIILSTHPSESTLLPNEPSTITSDTSFPTSQHPMQTRSKNDIYKPKLGYAAQIDYTLIEPSSYKAVAQHPQWCTTMQDEFDALQKQGTWSLVTPPPNKNVCHTTRPLRQLDVKNAFLHSTLKEEVYMVQPQGYIDSTHPHHVCRLHKSIYGLKQTPRAWFESFTTQLLHLGFIASTADSSLFIYHHQQVIAYLLLYVDDIMLTMSRTSDALYVTQSKYASDLLIKHHMVDSKPAKTPCSPNTRLSLHEAPTSTHLTAAKRVLRYIKGTLYHGIAFTPGPLSLSVFSDADWAGDPNDRRSTLGLLVYLGSHPITWFAKKQPIVSRSSTESEYRALATASAEVCWIRTLLKDLEIYLSQPPILWCDNVSALTIASNPVFHARTKHIEVDFHFIRERVLRKDLVVKFVSTTDLG
uniref:Reverse transcriptase Ty1/copia-type domain-containing protein n=1 Tax=Fagus sylvatica TaxID=28930 RepID=A0A2N9FFT0_FAGSY